MCIRVRDYIEKSFYVPKVDPKRIQAVFNADVLRIYLKKLPEIARPECDGARTVSLSMYLENDGERKVPDRYRRQGFHMMNLKNHQWNDCIWEFPSLPRDCVSGFGFRYRINGRDTASGETAAFFVKKIWLEAVEHPGKESGWLPERNTVCYSCLLYTSRCV